jgi:hypothetical protein
MGVSPLKKGNGVLDKHHVTPTYFYTQERYATMLTLTPELVAILDEEIKKNPRTSRAELIRTAIEAWYIPMRKRPIDRSKSPRQ